MSKNKKHFVQCASCPVMLPEDTARDIDALVKTLPQGCNYVRKAVAVDYMFEPNERAEVSILATDQVDQSNEVVLPQGINLENYRSSMTVHWMHMVDIAVATCRWIKLQGNAIRAMTVYPEKPDVYDGDWLTDQIWAMTICAPPILRCKSIGFLPTLPLRDPTPEELAEHPEWQGAGVYESGNLLEYSCVLNGCNTDAVVQQVQKGLDVAKLTLMGFTLPAPTPPPEPKPEVIIKAPPVDWLALCVQKAIKMPAKKKVIKKRRQPTKQEIIEAVMGEINLERIIKQATKLHHERNRA